MDIPATSDNIPGTLVLRDASGNLSAGQITANVTGNLTGTASAIADNTVTSAKIVDGTIVDADISASAAIGKTKISGTAITAADSGTVTSTMIADGTIVDADISASAAIGLTKLATGALPDAITVSSNNLVNGTVVDADISGSASIAHSKLASVTSGNVIMGNASNVATSTAVTGDVTISNTGVTTITAGAVGTSDVADAAITAPKLSGAQAGSAPIYGCRAWVNFDGSAGATVSGEFRCTIRGSGNVSKVVRSATGKYTVHFTTAMDDTNYCVVSSGNDGVPDTTFRGTNNISQNNTASTCEVWHKGVNSANQAIENGVYINVAIFR